MTLTTETQTIQIERLVYRSSIPFSTAESRLRSSIRPSPGSSLWGAPQGQGQAQRPTDRESYEARVKSLVGPHGFMYFHEFNHGLWLPFYEPPSSTVTVKGVKKNLNCKRFVLGNPMIAITILQHDLSAGLCVPVELCLVEEAEGGVKIVWYKPTSLIAGYEGAKQELVDAANALSIKLETFVKWVLRDDEGEGKL
ncbi:uncharacterized protein Z519_01660 [Cladophialophora bantiana CBS 173.52]|uniref:DUF302 domain-containing protein n=1 Tax=Cladophialophora bantiana (strain ATCC 10958 / CBS 173.52 / CDC B-1940 / NIH 8579) TaxID=1442370 RepID=A0A0D2F7L9_CLAB1|nr:uncharacterized protein Z519_01660 [Cladophialophora bantiana CBS 173.52]KIW98076.1 hypothetical protein Z519_01660 [Cladophialophora bantiana CBS 173.52]